MFINHKPLVFTMSQLAQFVFIHHDTHWGPLKSAYNGPIQFLAPEDKPFVHDIGTRHEHLTVDLIRTWTGLSTLQWHPREATPQPPDL